LFDGKLQGEITWFSSLLVSLALTDTPAVLNKPEANNNLTNAPLKLNDPEVKKNLWNSGYHLSICLLYFQMNIFDYSTQHMDSSITSIAFMLGI
jgi:hypothetical protein